MIELQNSNDLASTQRHAKYGIAPERANGGLADGERIEGRPREGNALWVKTSDAKSQVLLGPGGEAPP